MNPAPSLPHPPNFTGRLAARLAWALAAGVAVTTRWSIQDEAGVLGPQGIPQAIFAIWHNRQLMAPEVHRRFLQQAHPHRRLASIASASRDGAIAARVLEHFGATAVRGSSSRRGARALAELMDLAKQGFDLAVTPDGPRGPRYEVKPGVIALAQHTGLPLIPASLHLSHKKVLRNWDGFQIPLPFGRCEVHMAPALQVPRDLDEAGRHFWAQELQSRLCSITRD